MDENDEAPVFQPQVGCATVTEFHDPRVAITTVQAVDKDDPATLNGKILFSIDTTNDRGTKKCSKLMRQLINFNSF